MKTLRRCSMLVLSLSLIASSILPVSAAAPHWAQTILTQLQNESYYPELDLTDQQLNEKISGDQFYELLGEMAAKHLLLLPTQSPIKLDKTMNRYSAALLIYKLFASESENLSAVKLTYKDIKGISTEQTSALKWHLKHAVMKGSVAAFKGNDPLTIGEGVAIMNQLKSLLEPSDNNAKVKDQADLTKDLSASWQTNKDSTQSLLISWGEKNTGGYAIQVVKEELVGNLLTVSVKLIAPAPDAMVTQAITYPQVVLSKSYAKTQAAQLRIQLKVVQ